MHLFDVRIIRTPKDGKAILLVTENDVLAKDEQMARDLVMAKHGTAVREVLDECRIVIRPFRSEK